MRNTRCSAKPAIIRSSNTLAIFECEPRIGDLTVGQCRSREVRRTLQPHLLPIAPPLLPQMSATTSRPLCIY